MRKEQGDQGGTILSGHSSPFTVLTSFLGILPPKLWFGSQEPQRIWHRPFMWACEGSWVMCCILGLPTSVRECEG